MRKEEIIELQDGDRTITFSVKQMSALKLERWMNRALILLAKASGQGKGKLFTMNQLKSFMGESKSKSKDDAAQKIISLIGGLNYEEVEPLWNELLECCQIITDPTKPSMRMALTPSTIEGNIESPITLYKLRIEAAKVNFSFFQGMNSPTTTSPDAITFPKATKTLRR